MICPLCSTWRSKKSWSDGQWAASRAITNGIIGCKICRVNPRPALDVLSDKRQLVHRFAQALQKGRNCTWWARLIWNWMHGLSADYRKGASHLGAVRCFDETHHPPHGTCPVLGDYFDPGNWVYATILILLVPGIVNTTWSYATLGDIIEGMLATGMRPSSGTDSRTIALYLEYLSGLLYTIVCWFPQVRTADDVIFLIDFAEEFSNGSFIGYDSKWGNLILPVIPDVDPE